VWVAAAPGSATTVEHTTALVTGASRGIGAAIATRLAEAGADVAVGCGQRRAEAEEVAEKIRSIGRRATVVSGDLGDPDVPARLVRETEAELGPVGVLVANAGVGPRAEIEDVDAGAWDHAMAVNLRAPFLLAKAVIPGMRERGYGRLIFISSVAAFNGGILAPQYTASKAGLIGLTHSLAAPLARHGITVNAVAPGLIETDMTADDPRVADPARLNPMGRLGRAEEIADAVAMVAANSFVTGQTISVDGGLYPR
jgi:3-oxoacyl-[acyl-carrier protein] reductase